jgi:hypothetical protein
MCDAWCKVKEITNTNSIICPSSFGRLIHENYKIKSTCLPFYDILCHGLKIVDKNEDIV